MRALQLGALAVAVSTVLAARDAVSDYFGWRVDPSLQLSRFDQEAVWYAVYWLMWAALTPLIFFLSRRVRFRRSAWLGPLAFHGVVAFAVAGIAPVLLGMLFGVLVLGYGWPSSVASLFTPLWLNLAGYRAPADAPIYWIILGVGVVLSVDDAYREKQLQTAHLERSLASAQLEALKMKLQPHFLFNTLNSIAFLALEKDAGAIETMVERLGRLLRASTETGGRQVVPLSEELSLLDQYLAIEEVRFKDRLRVVRRVEPGAEDAMVPSLLLQPVVENSIKHGFSRRIDASRIDMDVTRDGDDLVVTVRDDGPGLPPGWDLGAHCGRGLRSVVERLDALYRSRWSFSLQNGPDGGAVAELRIPYDRVAGRPEATRPGPPVTGRPAPSFQAPR